MTDTLNPEGLIKGQRYRVQFKGPRSTKEMVARYLSANTDGSLAFDLRPVAGTTVLLSSEITAMFETDAPIKVSHPVRGEKRVF